MTADLTVLGHRVDPADAPLECVGCPGLVGRVAFEGAELTALCPVTGQPDLYSFRLSFTPVARSIESKSLKLYLGRFRNVGIFAEELADRIAAELTELVGAPVHVFLSQSTRGGMTIEVAAEGVVV